MGAHSGRRRRGPLLDRSFSPTSTRAPLGRMLLEIIMRREVSFSRRNLFDCAKGRPFSESIAKDPAMFEVITAFFIALSVGILIAHALDAFRSRPGPKAKTQQRS
jgi:hypothetical protein